MSLWKNQVTSSNDLTNVKPDDVSYPTEINYTGGLHSDFSSNSR